MPNTNIIPTNRICITLNNGPHRQYNHANFDHFSL